MTPFMPVKATTPLTVAAMTTRSMVEDGNDVLFGGVGSAPASGVGCELQTAFIAAGSSYLTKGGSGDDTIYGGEGNDCIDAGSGEDLVYGEGGNDTLEGGNHGDVLDGGPGDDHLDGGWHSDTCIGGGGNDAYVSCEDVVDTPAVCDDGTCDDGEDSCSCPQDCGVPPSDESVCDGLRWTMTVTWILTVMITIATMTLHVLTLPLPFPGAVTVSVTPVRIVQPVPMTVKVKPTAEKRIVFCCGDGIAQSNEGDGSICDGNY